MTGHGGGAQTAVLDYLKAHGRAGRKEIEQATGLSQSGVRTALIELGRKGLVVKIAAGPREFYYEPSPAAPTQGFIAQSPDLNLAPPTAAGTARPSASPAPLPLGPVLIILRLMIALASALYLAQETREALGLASAPLQGLTPAAYLAFLGFVLGGRELAAWRGAGKSFARFEAEIILAAWWLLDLGIVALVNLGRPAWRMPPELWSLTWGSTLAVAAAKGSSALRKASQRRKGADEDRSPGPAWAAAFTLLAAGALFGLFLFLPRPENPPSPPPRSRPQASPPPRRANSPPDGPEGARPTAWTAPPRLRPRAPGEDAALIAHFSGSANLFSCPGLALKPVLLQDSRKDEPVPAYEARQEDGVDYFLGPRFGTIEIRGEGAGFALTPAFGPASSLPLPRRANATPEGPEGARPRAWTAPPGAPGRLEIGPNGPACAGLWLYAGAYGSTSLFFALSRDIVRGVLLQERPWRDAVPGLRPDRAPAVLLWAISPADLDGREGLVSAKVSEDASGCQSVSLVGPGSALAHRQDEVCGPRGRCARVFNRIARRGDVWLWYQWWYDDAVGYPAMLAPAPDCSAPADFRPI